jgi:hypothetical protein
MIDKKRRSGSAFGQNLTRNAKDERSNPDDYNSFWASLFASASKPFRPTPNCRSALKVDTRFINRTTVV